MNQQENLVGSLNILSRLKKKTQILCVLKRLYLKTFGFLKIFVQSTKIIFYVFNLNNYL
jgi:hypothetical protein